jgi:hypothetical protein
LARKAILDIVVLYLLFCPLATFHIGVYWIQCLVGSGFFVGFWVHIGRRLPFGGLLFHEAQDGLFEIILSILFVWVPRYFYKI